MYHVYKHICSWIKYYYELFFRKGHYKVSSSTKKYILVQKIIIPEYPPVLKCFEHTYRCIKCKDFVTYTFHTPVLLPQKLNFKVSYVSFSCWKCIEVWNLHTCRYFGRFLCPQSSFVCKRAFINRNQSRLCRHKFCMADLLSKHTFLASNGKKQYTSIEAKALFQSSMGFWGNLSEKLSTRRYCLTTYHRRNLWQTCIMAGYFILRSMEWKGKLKVIESLLKTLAPPPPKTKTCYSQTNGLISSSSVIFDISTIPSLKASWVLCNHCISLTLIPF